MLIIPVNETARLLPPVPDKLLLLLLLIRRLDEQVTEPVFQPLGRAQSEFRLRRI